MSCNKREKISIVRENSPNYDKIHIIFTNFTKITAEHDWVSVMDVLPHDQLR
jgi:hypothetical protein